MSDTWQERLVWERYELAGRIEKLDKFKESKEFPDIKPADRVLLVDQHATMSAYLRILDRRIERSTDNA